MNSSIDLMKCNLYNKRTTNLVGISREQKKSLIWRKGSIYNMYQVKELGDSNVAYSLLGIKPRVLGIAMEMGTCLGLSE